MNIGMKYGWLENNLMTQDECGDYKANMNDLPVDAMEVDLDRHVQNQTQDDFQLTNILPAHRDGWRRYIICDIIGKTRFMLKPSRDLIPVNVYRSLQGSIYEFHILDFNRWGFLKEHHAFAVDTKISS